MGWWNIGDDKYDMVNGDTPADIMGDAINEIVKAYEKEWDRKPYRKEMQAVFSFTSSLPQYYTEEVKDETD
jgi:hypothetical protein